MAYSILIIRLLLLLITYLKVHAAKAQAMEAVELADATLREANETLMTLLEFNELVQASKVGDQILVIIDILLIYYLYSYIIYILLYYKLVQASKVGQSHFSDIFWKGPSFMFHKWDEEAQVGSVGDAIWSDEIWNQFDRSQGFILEECT